MDEQGSLVDRSRRGDLDAFNVLVGRYQGQVFNLALRMLGDMDLASDAAQETFISAYRAIGGFRGGSFRSWLLRIAANACRDLLRAAKARPTLPLEVLELEPGPASMSREESPEEYTLRRELGRLIHQGLESLSYHRRLAVVLVDVQGFSYEDAASIMQASVGTLKSRLSRAREQLREFFGRHRELLPKEYRL